MFITHDLSVVKHISTTIVIMYLGEIVEFAPTDALFDSPKHPYAQALLSAIPIPAPSSARVRRELIKGEITSAINPAPGCRFAPRCPLTKPECTKSNIPLRHLGGERFVRCAAI
jgi:oligopeptide/dipeptide ABC transporter ATP-binding protein